MTPVTQSYINAVRFYINDSPELNVLLDIEESSDEKIEFCLNLCIQDINLASSITGATYSIESFPSFSLLLDGTIVRLLRSAGLLHSRNQLPYSAGGLSVQLWGKAKDYMAWIQLLQSEYESKKATFVRQQNVRRAFNATPYGLHSDYFLGFSVIPGTTQV